MARAKALVALFLCLHAVHFTTSASMKKDLSRATTNKTKDLVDALKQDLRKNNDDYKELRGAAALRNPYLGGELASELANEPGAGDAPGNELGPARRRMDLGRPRATAISRGTAASGGATKAALASIPAAAAAAAAAAVIRRNKVDKNSKLHQLLAKEGLLFKFLRGLPDAGKKKYIDWIKENPRQGVEGDRLGDAEGEGEGGGELRERAFDSQEYFRPTPDTVPEHELDMIAATGEHIANLKRRLRPISLQPETGKLLIYIDKNRLAKYQKYWLAFIRDKLLGPASLVVHTLLLAGRLCYRHILFPEGPKYDSRGKVYLKAHDLSFNFQATRKPKLLLPRCCNCCQKSVLGCE